MNNIEQLYKYLPVNNIINWELIEEGILKPFYKSMESTNQEPKWHGEGNVLIHTKLVCEQLIYLDDYQKLSKYNQLQVFLSALFHDLGKTVCTKVVDGEITSPNHAVKGSEMVREYFWKHLDLSGTKQYQNFRETICLLIKYHSNPVYVGMDKRERKLIKIANNKKLASDFNLHLLSILSKADIKGRICIDANEQLSYVNEFIKMAKYLNCYYEIFEFKNDYTKFRYLNGKNVYYYDELYDNTKMEVTMICGLPGTGKDTFISNNYNVPVVSLDEIRNYYDLNDKDDQGKVFNIAKEQMKQYLRNKQSFVFNATNLIQSNRLKLIKIFTDYNAKVNIIFLETSWKENISRNNNRNKVVDKKIIEKMLSGLNIVEDYEAHHVEWIIV